MFDLDTDVLSSRAVRRPGFDGFVSPVSTVCFSFLICDFPWYKGYI